MSAPGCRRDEITEARRKVFNAYDGCFCDDVGQDPLCEICVVLHELIGKLDVLIERPDL